MTAGALENFYKVREVDYRVDNVLLEWDLALIIMENEAIAFAGYVPIVFL